MSELHDELRSLAHAVVACANEDVLATGEEIARQYQERRGILEALLNVDARVAGDDVEIDPQHPQFVALHEDL